MARMTQNERFLSELERLCNGQDTSVTNKSLREQLGWQDDRFNRVRTELLKKGTIKAAQGHGGKTKFAIFPKNPPEKSSLKAFISYSHADEEIKNQLMAHLKPLERIKLINSWNDRMIKPGENFASVISSELDDADIIFILVSIDFINSRYCYDVELSRAIERHENQKARVIPIILRDCLWKHSPFGGIQALPKDAKPVTSFHDRDQALAQIADSVHDLALELLRVQEAPSAK